MTTYELKAEVRTLFGRKSKRLRAEGLVPGNIFGKKIKSIAVQLDRVKLVTTMRAAGETGLIHLKLEGDTKTHPVLVAGYAKDPVTDQLTHVDFHEVDLTQKTKAAVPVKTVGKSPAVESGLVLVQLRNEIEVEALPTDLPDVIEVEISGLTEVGMSILAKNIKIDRSKVTLEIGDDEPVVSIQEPAKEEVVATPVAAEGEAAAEGKEGDKPAEGDKPKEGEKPAVNPEAKKE
jgi:large subunit ribosomal protein L25